MALGAIPIKERSRNFRDMVDKEDEDLGPGGEADSEQGDEPLLSLVTGEKDRWWAM